jgi:hypothetical protein
VIALEDVTPREEILENKDDASALQKAVKQSRKFSFASAGIPIGAILTLSKDESINCVVDSDNTVKFQDKVMSVSGSALLALQQLGYKWSAVAGTEYWLYSGETLLSLRSAREAQTN